MKASFIKRNLKNPDSMVIYNDIVYIDDYLKDEEKTNYTFVNYGGTNSYGAMVSSTAIFIDGIYFSNTDAEKDDFDNIDDYVIYTKAKLVLASYNLVGSKSSDFSGVYIISGKKIANKLDVSYSEI